MCVVHVFQCLAFEAALELKEVVLGEMFLDTAQKSYHVGVCVPGPFLPAECAFR